MKENNIDTKSFEIKGQWFLPSNAEVRYSGTLIYHPNEGSSLELFGCLNTGSLDIETYETILGISSDNKLITLYDCFTTKTNVFAANLQSSNIPLSTYCVNYIIIGLHSSSINDIKFNKIKCEVFNLDEWIGISGFKPHLPRPEEYPVKEININYKILDPIEFVIDDSTIGRFNFTVKYSPVYRYQKSIKIEQQVELEINSNEDKSIWDLRRYLIKFQNFLILALYQSTYIHSISLSDRNSKKQIELYFSTSLFEKHLKSKQNLQMLFCYSQIKHDFEKIIQNWYKKYEVLEQTFDLVFEQFYNDNSFDENTFLNLAQSAETFHFRIHDYKRFSKEEYNIMQKEILDSVQTKYHKWLKEHFEFGNNLNLHTRLKELTEKYSNTILDKIIGDKEKFILQVKYSRNYYTHYSESLKKKALKGEELLHLSERLKILLVYAFLVEMGINENQIFESLDRNKWHLFGYFVEW